MVAIDWGTQIVEIISSLSNLAGQVYCKTIDISITLEMVWELCVRWGGGSEAVYLVRGSGWSRPFLEPHTRDRPKQPDDQLLATCRVNGPAPFSGRQQFVYEI